MMPEIPLLSTHFRNILLPRFDTFGDIVLLEGFLEALLQQFPEAKVTLLTRRACAILSCLFPERLEWLVTDIHPELQPPDKTLGAKLIEDMGTISPDLVLVTAHRRTWADNVVAANAKGAKRYALGQWSKLSSDCSDVFEELELSAGCPYEQTIPVLENSHEVEKYRAFWEALTGNPALPEPKLYANEHQRLAVDNILQSMSLQGKNFCLCSPAGTQNVAIKTWPHESFAETIVWLESERGIRCLVTGHRSEAGCVEAVAELARRKGAQPEIWLGRDGDIPLLAALLEAARFYLGNDTGPMHMAAAVGTPVIGIFGGGTWPRFIPRGATSIAIAGEMSCFGCVWDCIFGDAPCMGLVTVDDAKAAIDLLGQDDTIGPRILKASREISDETGKYIGKAIKTYREVNQDRIARLEDVHRLTRKLSEVIERFSKELSEVEADRAARLEIIERLNRTLAEVELDREARLRVIEQLDANLKIKEQKLDRIRRSIPVRIMAKLHLMPR
jgi:ADP-heptose:LPS heptosyltransferase